LVRVIVVSLVIVPVVVFCPAGTLDFWQGWAFVVVSLLAPVLLTFYLYKRDPQLLERRLLRKEKINAQKIILLSLKVLYFSALMLAGLDYRLGWSRAMTGAVPWWLTLLALMVVLGGHCWFAWVLKANRFAASVIQIETGQTIAASGPYRLVRHPMYLGGVVSWLAAPLTLGSFVTVPLFALVIPILMLRLLNEEKMLKRDLPGYVEYCQRTRWRLIPLIW
jgi:protein-S-isoprenylcysteine O-methyltransferase Ste14